MARECLAFRIRMLNRIVTGIYDEALSSAGLKVSQFSVLVAVSNEGKCRPSELAKTLQMDESTLSRNVERMCARGWLRLEPDQDRRSHLITITDKGMAMIQKAYPGWLKAQAEAGSQLGEDGIAALRSALRKFRR
ncbi:MAG TPA: MarR family winged helix-turn-helix transcriptional regulator [Candidatus Binataceae bacterium]|jgi:DNA-binding MarR family transcriptional regulator